MENETDVQALPVYPKATTDGFYFLDEEDELLRIETQTYANGKDAKRVGLKDGRKAIVRILKAWEMEETQRFHKNNSELMMMAVAAKAIKIDDKNVLFEDIKNMDAPDWVSIKGAVALLNFQ